MTRKILIGVWVILCLTVVGSVSSSAFQGRFKDDGNGGCFFDPNDDGPNQCTPSGPGAAGAARPTSPASATASRRGQ